LRGFQSIPSLNRQATSAVKLKRHTVIPLRVCHLEQINLWHCAGDVENRVDPAKALKRNGDDRRWRLWLTQIDGNGQRLGAYGTSEAATSKFSLSRATRTTAEKSRARLSAVARPMPWLAPVTTATDLTFTELTSISKGSFAQLPESHRPPASVPNTWVCGPQDVASPLHPSDPP